MSALLPQCQQRAVRALERDGWYVTLIQACRETAWLTVVYMTRATGWPGTAEYVEVHLDGSIKH